MVFHWYFKIPEGIGFQPHVESRWKIGYIRDLYRESKREKHQPLYWGL